MNEKISKALILVGMIVIAFPKIWLIVIAAIGMITSLFSEFSDISDMAGPLVFIAILGICAIAMVSYFCLAINFLRKGRSDSGKQRGVHFYVVLAACFIVLLSYLLVEILPEFPLGIFAFGIDMVFISLHVLLEYGLVKLLINNGKAARAAQLL